MVAYKAFKTSMEVRKENAGKVSHAELSYSIEIYGWNDAETPIAIAQTTVYRISWGFHGRKPAGSRSIITSPARGWVLRSNFRTVVI